MKRFVEVIVVAAAVASLTGCASMPDWPSAEPPVLTDCDEDGSPRIWPDNDLRLPVSIVAVADIEDVSYRGRQTPVVAYVDCPNAKRKDVKIVTNSWGFARVRLQVLQVLRGTGVQSTIYSFHDVGEWGPPKGAQTLHTQFLVCLRQNGGRLWMGQSLPLEKSPDGDFVMLAEHLEQVDLSARAGPLRILVNGASQDASGALLNELELDLLCARP